MIHAVIEGGSVIGKQAISSGAILTMPGLFWQRAISTANHVLS